MERAFWPLSGLRSLWAPPCPPQGTLHTQSWPPWSLHSSRWHSFALPSLDFKLPESGHGAETGKASLLGPAMSILSWPGLGVALGGGPLLALSWHLPTVGLRSLRLLVLHSNLLTSVPTGLVHLPLLTRLDLRDNQLRDVPPELLDAPFVRLQGNPLGEALPAPQSPPGRLVPGKGQTTDRPGCRYCRYTNSCPSLHRGAGDPGNAQTVPELRCGQVCVSVCVCVCC